MVKPYYLILLSFVLLIACKSDEDDTIPEIQILDITWDSGAYLDQDTIAVMAGEQITIVSELSDDQNLTSHKVELFSNAPSVLHSDENAWSRLSITPLSGTLEIKSNTLNVPVQADGFFALQMNLIDDQGNSAIPFDLVIDVLNLDYPSVAVDSLNGLVPTSTHSLTQDQTFVIKGMASDIGILESVSLNWLFGNVILTTNEYSISQSEVDLESFEFNAPSDLTGEVDFYLSFRDGDQNVKNCWFSAVISE